MILYFSTKFKYKTNRGSISKTYESKYNGQYMLDILDWFNSTKVFAQQHGIVFIEYFEITFTNLSVWGNTYMKNF